MLLEGCLAGGGTSSCPSPSQSATQHVPEASLVLREDPAQGHDAAHREGSVGMLFISVPKEQ